LRTEHDFAGWHLKGAGFGGARRGEPVSVTADKFDPAMATFPVVATVYRGHQGVIVSHPPLPLAAT
jgi:hypothetical protein